MLILILLSTAFAARIESIGNPHSIANERLPLDGSIASAIDDVSGHSEKEELTGYGEWIVATPCTDSCGACGRTHMFRECLCAEEEGCPCSKPESRI
ncbi:hypothetical protein PENTCL1PPCAC_733, partial [Pristionchus entomophagus]